MKLTPKLKKKIEDYFNNINPEQLYIMSIEKYNFTPCYINEIDFDGV